MSATLNDVQRSMAYSRQATADELRADLEQLSALDDLVEEKLASLMRLALGALLGTVVSFLAMMISEGHPLAIAAVAVFGISTIVLFARRQGQKSADIDDRRLELATGLVRLLAVDARPDAPMSLTMDLRKVDHLDKMVRKGKVGPWSVVWYSDPWLRLEGRLRDGTTFRFVHEHLFQHRSKRKVNPRGKVKHKSKTKAASKMNLRLRYKAERYAASAAVGDAAQGAVQLPKGLELAGFEHTAGQLAIKTASRGEWFAPGKDVKRRGVDALEGAAMMFLSLYQVLNVSKAAAKAARKE